MSLGPGTRGAVVCALALMLGLSGLGPGAGLAQSDICAGDADLVAVQEGRFEGSAALDPDTEIDAIAALEQQSWRAFGWSVLETSCFTLTVVPVDTGAGAAPQAVLRASADGETFTPYDGQPLAAGAQLAAIVTQRRAEEPAGLRFVPSRWRLELAGRAAQGATGPFVMPVAAGGLLGCDRLGCGAPAEAAGTTAAVSGEPAPDASHADPAPAAGGGDNELAAELQRELARLGCYRAAVDGLWGPASRRAMADFNEKSSKALVVETPTAKALAEVARAADPVCSGN